MSLFDKISVLRELKNRNSELESKIIELKKAIDKKSKQSESSVTLKKFEIYKKRLISLESQEEKLLTIIKRISSESEKLLSE